MSGGMRIGELAQRTGVTPRTIRYYEERGLLGGAPDREAGRHRLYDEHDVDRVNEILRLRDVLGLSLEELLDVVEHEEARALLRTELREADPPPARRAQILDELEGHITRQLELLDRRRTRLDELEDELRGKLGLIDQRRSELHQPAR